MHSFGGVTGTNSLQDISLQHRQSLGLPGGVVHLVYQCAFLVPINTSNSTRFGGKLPPTLIADDNTGTYTITDHRNAFYNDLPKDEQDYYLSKLVACPIKQAFDPVTYNPYGPPLPDGGQLDGGLKATYIVCEKDEGIPMEVQEGMARLLGPGREMVYVDAGHSAMISRTGECVEIVKRVWERSEVFSQQ